MAQETIFSKKFLLAFLSILTQAAVMYILITTISEHATTLGATATIAGLISGIYILDRFVPVFIRGMRWKRSDGKKWQSGPLCFIVWFVVATFLPIVCGHFYLCVLFMV